MLIRKYLSRMAACNRRFWSWFKPRSFAGRITLLVSLVSLCSLVLTMNLFWRNLYLPELRQHANHLAIELALVEESIRLQAADPFAFQTHRWILQNIGVEIVTNPERFPVVHNKLIAEFFTEELRKELERRLHEPVTVYFEFKPVPQLWIYYPSLGNVWLREPVIFYQNYSPELLIGWLLGIPLLTLIVTVVITRQLTRPLVRLQVASQQYVSEGTGLDLDTRHGPIELRQANRALNQMMQTIQQTEQERSIMLAGISHDIRTPLTRMRLTSEMLEDEEAREGLIADINDMDAILEQFISFMKDGSDEKPQWVDINALISEVISQFRDIPITFSAGEDIPQLWIRPFSIRRIFINLITNAIKYGVPPIDICTRFDETEAVIQVRDRGEGIDLDKAHSLFQPFVRGEVARTTQGSGLGLSIVKRIIEHHKGRVSLHNHPEGGLSVEIRIPLLLPFVLPGQEE